MKGNDTAKEKRYLGQLSLIRAYSQLQFACCRRSHRRSLAFRNNGLQSRIGHRHYEASRSTRPVSLFCLFHNLENRRKHIFHPDTASTGLAREEICKQQLPSSRRWVGSYLLDVSGVHDSGCHCSLGPPASFAHGLFSFFFFFFPTSSTSSGVPTAFFTPILPSLCSGPCWYVGSVVPIAGPGCCSLGLSRYEGFWAHLSSASRANCFIWACRTRSFCCSSIVGASGRTCRSH